MGIENGVLKIAESSFKWGGNHNKIESWNADQTARTWLLNSVVWYSQKVTPQLGLDFIVTLNQTLKNLPVVANGADFELTGKTGMGFPEMDPMGKTVEPGRSGW